MDDDAQNEAKCLIERIKSEYTLNRSLIGPRFEALVTNSLDVLSSQLYERSTHFLLEVIQNADDNSYDAPTPTLSFSYSPGSLRIDCNETGFTAQDVEAICAISQSTKAHKKADGDYIGEKGIGFKSVFKAADVVWISSRHYTFKFDKTRFLGMVTPIWEDFPGKPRPGWTSLHLRLARDFDEDILVHELHTFDANLLIFLRHVKEFHIDVSGKAGAWAEKISKHVSEEGNDHIVTLRTSRNISKYLIRTYLVGDLPSEKKRKGWTETKLLLGFPKTDGHEAPSCPPQKVYAFLPIRNYGLKFLLQGDFLLTASREDIESTLPWNCRLRDAVAEAFIEAVHHFNTGDMKYVWPWYLPDSHSTTTSIFDSATQSMFTRLQQVPVLESCAGTMEQATTLEHISSDACVDEDGKPFTMRTCTARRYLATDYPCWATPGVLALGVKQQSPKSFLNDLQALISEEPQLFHAKSPSWHTQLAECLFKLSTDDELLEMMRDIRLIPLEDGTWSSSNGKPIFFANNQSSLEIPSGIDVLVVHNSAETDATRRKLLVSLGVKEWEATEICRLIVQVHRSQEFVANDLSTTQLIFHATFLYKADWKPANDVDIWFATSEGQRCLGRKIYLAATNAPDSAASRVFAALQKQFPVIHNGYIEAFASDR